MKNTPMDSRLAGQRNEQLILSLLREHGPLSQTQLCNMINLGSSTASSIVSRLRDKELVIETRGQSDRRGPKPVLLKINPCVWYVVGIEINPSYVFMGLFDFTATLRETRKSPLSTDHSVEHVLEVIKQTFPSLTALCGGNNGKLLGIGVTVSGSISADGVVQLSSPLGWEQVPLKELMERRLSRTVSVHSTRVRLMAEITQQPQLQSRSILYLNVANGVGATVYMNGQLITGTTGRYGEIGHIIVQPDGPRCGCGHQGCLEAMISGRAIAERIRKDVNEGAKTMLTEWMSRTDDKVPEEIVTLWGRAVGQQDPYALEIRDFIAGYLSRAAAMSINAFDPDTVILAGYVCRQCPEYFAQSIRNAMNEQVYDSPRRDIRVMVARCGEEALITGVAMAMLQDTLLV
jgi:predicted NBD/HSP70 family sugar kinase